MPDIEHSGGEIIHEVLERTRTAILTRFQNLRQRVWQKDEISKEDALAADQEIQNGIISIKDDLNLEGQPKPPSYDTIISGSGYRISDSMEELDIEVIDRIQELISTIEAKYFSDGSEGHS